MSTRKIKDAKNLSTNELIYFKGHAQATNKKQFIFIMNRRNILIASAIEGIDCSEPIIFYVTDTCTDITAQYISDGCMTWEEWIDSDYNPYLPNGIDKSFGKTSDLGRFSGYVWYHFFDPSTMQIDHSTEIVDLSTYQIVSLNSKIKDKITYMA